MTKLIHSKKRDGITRVIKFEGAEVLAENHISHDMFADLKKIVESEHVGQSTLVEMIYKIGNLKDPRSVIPLYHRLYDARANVRQAAAASLGRLKQSSRIAKAKLLHMFNNKKEEMPVRAAAAGALGEIGDINALEPLIRSMNGKKDENMHSVIAHALGDLRDKRALPSLNRALKKYEADEGNPVRSFLLSSIDNAIGKIEEAQ